MIIFILLFVTGAFGAQESPDNCEDGSACIGDKRTVLSIIWSCLVTIFACTWLAVHPNVPGHKITSKGTMSCAIERAKIIAVTILAPEIIVGWAAEQFIVAWKLPDEAASTSPPSPPSSVNATPSTSISLSKCGFLPDDTSGAESHDVPGTLVTLEALESEPNLMKNLAAIRPETIEDRSKGDALSKTVSILQLSWFIVQCIARALQNLPITLLEMSALAFAGLSIIMYSLWWYKPFNVKYQISLDGSEWPETNHPKESAFPVPRSWVERAQNIFVWVLIWIPGITLGLAVDEFCGHEFYRFYSGTSEEATKQLWTMVCAGSLFGVIHCVAWSFSFPSHAEMVLWRFSMTAVVAGLVIGSNGMLFMALVHLINPEWEWKLMILFNAPWKKTRPWVKILRIISVPMTVVGITSYIVARIVLIILAFLQLHSLPLDTFCTVQWTTYIPHI
ncbi:hypothetical protein EDD18DRAFT_1298165 [Armillaria luteobubalina]|uniref:Uncharacterized protein n=1 Tax=Armillaria luteobubalina TaxID=153913 RepID=A0AA39P152_9AGAR|nr:hypothetical protein EDD18DRAFT_1298165 [Armillaria luteobubalina]